jgi:hypothetical protein
MKRVRALSLVLVTAAAIAPAHAQQGNDPAARCRNGAIPFAASEANRLGDAQIRDLFIGKKLGYIRESTRTPGIYINATRELRADGSVEHHCSAGRGPNGPWKACAELGSDRQAIKGSRDVGVWRIANRALCVASASFGERSEGCFSIHREGTTLAAKQTGGPRSHCIEGVVTAR